MNKEKKQGETWFKWKYRTDPEFRKKQIAKSKAYQKSLKKKGKKKKTKKKYKRDPKKLRKYRATYEKKHRRRRNIVSNKRYHKKRKNGYFRPEPNDLSISIKLPNRINDKLIRRTHKDKQGVNTLIKLALEKYLK